VVTKNVPPHTIVAGVPAKVIGMTDRPDPVSNPKEEGK
jgi:acetyltransferase-like isoleucine patch superfamily enzyme